MALYICSPIADNGLKVVGTVTAIKGILPVLRE